jgi:hypothetical protein
MTTRTFEVKNYSIHLTRNMEQSPGCNAVIQCKGPDGEKYSVLFYMTGDHLPNNFTDFDKGTAGISHRPSAEYIWYIDLLRNEHPVWATLDDRNPDQNRIWCSEPVGEGEIFVRPSE